VRGRRRGAIDIRDHRFRQGGVLPSCTIEDPEFGLSVLKRDWRTPHCVLRGLFICFVAVFSRDFFVKYHRCLLLRINSMPHKALWVNHDATQEVKYIEGGYKPSEGELLLKCICVGVNPGDWTYLPLHNNSYGSKAPRTFWRCRHSRGIRRCRYSYPFSFV